MEASPGALAAGGGAGASELTATGAGRVSSTLLPAPTAGAVDTLGVFVALGTTGLTAGALAGVASLASGLGSCVCVVTEGRASEKVAATGARGASPKAPGLPRYHSYAAAPTTHATRTSGISQRAKLPRLLTLLLGSSAILDPVECSAGEPSAGVASGRSRTTRSASRFTRRA